MQSWYSTSKNFTANYRINGSTIDALAGLMRLSRRYEAEDLYAHCLFVFRKAWPDTMDRESVVQRGVLQKQRIQSLDSDSDNKHEVIERQALDPGKPGRLLISLRTTLTHHVTWTNP